MKPDIYNFVSSLATDYGVDAAAEVAAFEAKHVYAIRDFVEKENIDCDYTVTQAVDVQLDPNHYKKLKQGFQWLVESGCAPTKTGQYVDAENAQAVSLPLATSTQFTTPCLLAV